MSTTLSDPLVAGDPVHGEDAAATDGITSRSEQAITAFIVALPFLALAFGIVWFWGDSHARQVCSERAAATGSPRPPTTAQVENENWYMPR